ncbi:MAG: LysR family transcriptional regulator [Proteobacteria bacterium]|nr:MAG: LysR family transcriptional regulator [Pseudomonadota bacterium]
MNNLRQLIPSTSMLLAFEAAARHLNFTRAAEELSLTQSAISRQVQALEALLELELFRRNGRMLELTEIGRCYALDLAPALARVHGASSRALAFRGGASHLHLSALPTFTARWLMPRLADFYEHHPDVVVHLHARSGEYALENSGLDAAINVGVEPFPGLITHRLLDEEMIVVGSPESLARDPVRSPADVVRFRLLLNTNRLEAWREWFDLNRLPVRTMRPGAQFDVGLHQIQAASAGIGLALVARFLVEAELEAGTLVEPDIPGLPGRRAYYLMYQPDKAEMPTLAAFRQWLMVQSTGTRASA